MLLNNITGYKNLVLWRVTKRLVILIYKLTDKFPRSEEFALKSQMRRAAVSVLSQIAEGWLTKSVKDKLHYLEISLGSLLELETQAEVSFEVGYWSKLQLNEFSNQRARVGYLLYRYNKSIEN